MKVPKFSMKNDCTPLYFSLIVSFTIRSFRKLFAKYNCFGTYIHESWMFTILTWNVGDADYTGEMKDNQIKDMKWWWWPSRPSRSCNNVRKDINITITSPHFLRPHISHQTRETSQILNRVHYVWYYNLSGN